MPPPSLYHTQMHVSPARVLRVDVGDVTRTFEGSHTTKMTAFLGVICPHCSPPCLTQEGFFNGTASVQKIRANITAHVVVQEIFSPRFPWSCPLLPKIFPVDVSRSHEILQWPPNRHQRYICVTLELCQALCQ